MSGRSSSSSLSWPVARSASHLRVVNSEGLRLEVSDECHRLVSRAPSVSRAGLPLTCKSRPVSRASPRLTCLSRSGSSDGPLHACLSRSNNKMGAEYGVDGCLVQSRAPLCQGDGVSCGDDILQDLSKKGTYRGLPSADPRLSSALRARDGNLFFMRSCPWAMMRGVFNCFCTGPHLR